MDLPSDDESAGWWITPTPSSMPSVTAATWSSWATLGGFTAPLVCARVPVDLVVLLAAMIPAPGELFSDWWTNTGYREVRGRLLPRHRSRARCRGETARTGREFPGAAPAVATADVAGGPDEVLAVP